MSGDEFAIILLSEREPDRIIAFADMIRRAVTTPITYAEREIFLTASIGLALHDPPDRGATRGSPAQCRDRHGRMPSASGGDRIEVFRPTMRSDRSDQLTLEAICAARSTATRSRCLFKPIVRLEDRTIAGFESMLRWDHPRLGRLGPEDFISIAEESGLIVNLGVFLLERPPASSPPGRRRSKSSRRSSPASTCRATISSVMTCCRM